MLPLKLPYHEPTQGVKLYKSNSKLSPVELSYICYTSQVTADSQPTGTCVLLCPLPVSINQTPSRELSKHRCHQHQSCIPSYGRSVLARINGAHHPLGHWLQWPFASHFAEAGELATFAIIGGCLSSSTAAFSFCAFRSASFSAGLSESCLLTIGCSCNSSKRLRDGTSPSQYLRHMFLYAASRPRVNFSPSQTGDFIISSRRLILSSCKAFTSDAKSNAKLTYSSSVLATSLPNPAKQGKKCQSIVHKDNTRVTVERKWPSMIAIRFY